MKYEITTGNVTTEFADIQSAMEYSSKYGITTSSIVEIPDDIVPVLDSASLDVFEQKIRDGYPIPNTPYILALEDKDRTQFSGMLVLTNELLQAGYITGDTSQSIKDKNDQIYYLTTNEFKSLMIGYGIYYKTIWNECEPKS